MFQSGKKIKNTPFLLRCEMVALVHPYHCERWGGEVLQENGSVLVKTKFGIPKFSSGK
jgi:hypothetical protein